MKFNNTHFVQSFTTKNDGRVKPLPEVIFIGRSNVGKSSLINALIGRRNLAYTSKKPGYTKLLNYFLVDDTFYLVDAPGYGYAKASRSVGHAFGKMMEDYFDANENLKQIYLLIDSRRELNDDDLTFLSFVESKGLPLTIIFTKADKLNQSLRAKTLNMFNKHFKGAQDQAFFTSSLKKENIGALQKHIEGVIRS